jgi:hypothetical protein
MPIFLAGTVAAVHTEQVSAWDKLYCKMLCYFLEETHVQLMHLTLELFKNNFIVSVWVLGLEFIAQKTAVWILRGP